MGISSALYSGVSGLNTNGAAMSVIGNNLANTNTVGFKGSRTVFADLLSGSINGSGGFSQVGRGVGMSKVDQIFSQGTFQSTESGLDVAIEGEGFFVLKEAGDETSYYSRAGAFRFNDDGYLVNPEGLRVQGKLFDETGELAAGNAEDLQVSNTGLIGGNSTSELTLNTNLDSSEAIKPALAAGWDITDDNLYNYSSSVQVFDTLGNPHLLSTYFVKTGANEWQWAWSADLGDGNPPLQGIGGVNGALPADRLNFTVNGLLENSDPENAIPPQPVGTEPIDTTGDIPAIDWGNGSDPTGVQVTFSTTQFNSESVVISQNQNGYGAGNLTGVDIDGEGIVVASYSNGEQTKVGQLVLGKFINTGGLATAGSNLFTETTDSGPPRTGLPGPELGKIFTNSLEQSNVDMAAQFVEMITVQRGYQANSKIITTIDELLGEVINLKR